MKHPFRILDDRLTNKEKRFWKARGWHKVPKSVALWYWERDFERTLPYLIKFFR